MSVLLDVGYLIHCRRLKGFGMSIYIILLTNSIYYYELKKYPGKKRCIINLIKTKGREDVTAKC